MLVLEGTEMMEYRNEAEMERVDEEQDLMAQRQASDDASARANIPLPEAEGVRDAICGIIYADYDNKSNSFMNEFTREKSGKILALLQTEIEKAVKAEARQDVSYDCGFDEGLATGEVKGREDVTIELFKEIATWKFDVKGDLVTMFVSNQKLIALKSRYLKEAKNV